MSLLNSILNVFIEKKLNSEENKTYTINNILGGVRSTCTYIGSNRLKDISKCATFVRVNRLVNNFYKYEI